MDQTKFSQRRLRLWRKGRTQYILTIGIMWAIPTILFVEIGPLFMPGSQTSFLEYVVSLVGYSAVGIMLGYGFWKQTNDACQERLREGRCLSCNYDVREAKDRCPNCGNPKLLDSETPLHAARA